MRLSLLSALRPPRRPYLSALLLRILRLIEGILLQRDKVDSEIESIEQVRKVHEEKSAKSKSATKIVKVKKDEKVRCTLGEKVLVGEKVEGGKTVKGVLEVLGPAPMRRAPGQREAHAVVQGPRLNVLGSSTHAPSVRHAGGACCCTGTKLRSDRTPGCVSPTRIEAIINEDHASG